MVKHMEENKELLIFIHENTKMGINSTKKLLSLIKDKDNKIKKVLEEEHQRYKELNNKCKKLIKKEKIEIENKGLIANITSNIAMSVEVSKDNSDSKIASILSRGFNMGNIDIEAKIKNYKKEVKSDTLDLANDLLKFGEKQIKLLKDFL